ncbi:hypothetical protein Tco_1319500 [Tanacetum coccineum]
MLSEAQGVSLRITSGVRELYTTFSTLAGKLWQRGRSWVFDLNKSDLCPSFVEGLTTKGLRPSRGEFPYWSIFIIQGVDGKFHFLPEGGVDENRSSTKSVNNEALVINAEHIFVVHPSNVAENNMDSHHISFDEGELSPIGHDIPSYLEKGKRSTAAGKRKVAVSSNGEGPRSKTQKAPAQASKVAGDASSPLDVDCDLDIHEFPSAKELKDATDCHWVIAHVTPPFWKQTRELISALHKARASCYAMREREIKKYKVYVELENKCNEALQDLDKNPLVSDMRAEIETLQSQDRATVVSNVILDTIMKLVHSDEMGVLIARLVKASIVYDRCSAFKEVAELKKPFILEEMPGYRPSSKEGYDRVGNDLADASYPFLVELTADPYASVEQLLSKKPQSLPLKRLSSKAS